MPDEVAERLRRNPSSLTETDCIVIAHAPLIAPKIIPSEIDTLLVANGIDLCPGHPSRGVFALAVARAHIQAARIERDRETGRPEIDTPPMPSPVRTPGDAKAPGEPNPERRLSALLER